MYGALAFLLALPVPAGPAAHDVDRAVERRGPFGVRDQWLLAQPRLALPASTPDPLPPGETRLGLEADWGNDFGWDLRLPVDADTNRSFLIDGEHRTLALEARHGLSPSVTLGARLPVAWRGPGVLDGVIDTWHRVTGLGDNGRPSFPRDRLRVEGRDPARRPIRWQGAEGTGLGRAEVNALWAVARGDRTRCALVGRLELPTGTGPWAGSGLDAGAQILAARALGGAADLYLGAGGTVFSDRAVDEIRYARYRAHAFAALEWRVAAATSLLIEGEASSRLVTGLEAYPGLQSYLRIGAKRDLNPRLRLSVGLVEGIKSLQTTTDFGLFFGVERRF